MIEKRGPNSWRYGFKVKTERGFEWVRGTIRLPRGMSDAKQRKEAEKALARLVVDYEAGHVALPAQREHTVRSFAELWMSQYVETNLKPTTYKNYRYFLDSRILPTLGDVPLKKLTPVRLSNWLVEIKNSPRRSTLLPDEKLKARRTPANEKELMSDEKRKKPLAPSTVHHYYTCMMAMLDKAVQWEVIPRNPMERVDAPVVKKSRPKYLTEEQAVALLRCLRDEPNMCYRAALLLALLCGLRLGEVGALRLSDVDWKAGTIDISHALNYTPRTGNYEGSPKSDASERLISLPPGMMAVLLQAKQYQEDAAARAGEIWQGEGWIVHAWNGAQLHHDTPSKWFRRFADAHGFEGVRFHDLRHTHATMLLANNIDAVAVATRMGHADASVTLRVYAHALRRRDDDAAQALQQLVDLAYGSSDDKQGE